MTPRLDRRSKVVSGVARRRWPVTDHAALPTLIELVDAARAGSEPALNAVLRNVEPALRDLLVNRYSNLKDPAVDPTDLLQLALIRISERIATCTATDSRGFVAWCMTVAHRVGLSELRKTRRAPQFLPLIKDVIDSGPASATMSSTTSSHEDWRQRRWASPRTRSRSSWAASSRRRPGRRWAHDRT
jgi:DNA-directed RNA polymerase specialized sigma24 family protein